MLLPSLFPRPPRSTVLLVALAAAASASAVAPSAAAQGSPQFNEGMKLLAQGDFDGACAAFERAEDPEPTMATRYQLGRCNEERGHFGTAYLRYRDAAAIAEKQNDAKRAEVAHQRAHEVEPKAAKLVIVVPPDRQVAGMIIKRDGKELPKQDWSKATVVEDGFHDIEVSAPGRQSIVLRVEAKGAGAVAKIAVPELKAAGEGSAPSAPVPVTPSFVTGAQPPAEPPPIAADDGPATERSNPAMFWSGTGLLVGGGLAALAGGAAFGVADAAGDGVPPAAIGSWIIGGALLATAIPLMVVGGRRVPVSPESSAALIVEPLVSPIGGGVRLRF